MVSYNYFLPVKYQFKMIIRTQESRLFHNLRTYRRINGSVRNLSHFLYDLIALDKVTGYSLEKNYASMFDASNKNCKESVFELQTSMSTANGANYRTQMHRWIGCSELWGWDEILPSAVLMNEFRKEGMTATTGRYDSRMYATIRAGSSYARVRLAKPR